MSTTPPEGGTPAGWYDDGSGVQRWWDGQQWTESRQDAADEPGADSAGAPQKRSRLWIVWVVLGGVVVLIAVLLAFLIPLMVQVITAAGPSAPGPARDAAIAVVEEYDEAWADADCDALESSTTEEFRAVLGLTDCAAFQEQAEYLDASTDDYTLSVTSVEAQADGSIHVATRESYLTSIDDNGEPLDEPVPGEANFIYTVIEVDGAWVIDDVTIS